MPYLIIGLVALGLLTALFTWFAQRKGTNEEPPITTHGDCSSCNGNDTRCEQACMMEAATKDIEYFDDEELDEYKGRPSDQYTDEETEQFAEVLETLQPQEVKPWGRSLVLRGINMPNGIKVEFATLAEGF